ncbi:MAG: hypothetical protein KKB50_07545 [Planctomycetes bacterium]|nr:hypothetical protein [Planctomycetota bacterium]
MSETSPDAASWALAAAAALRRHGSWTGRIHIQKHLFITKVLGLAAPPFEFVLYDYGPYSFELDESIIDLELFGLLGRSYPLAGYGPQYEPTHEGLRACEKLDEHSRDAIERVAAQLGSRKSQDLELIATCLWMEREENLADRDEVVQQVAQLKPKYSEETIRERLEEAHKIVDSLIP